jgi:glucose/mannose transport system substrate-binding protein
MKGLKSRLVWLLMLAIVAMPLLTACGGETATATPQAAVPTDTTAPAAAATDTTAPAAAATDTTAPAAGATATAPAMTPTEAGMAGETPTTGGATGGTTGNALDQLAAEGIKPDPSASGKFEFFSWWTAGGEAEGKNDILNLYKQLYPGVQVIDAAVAGGGGDQAKAVLKTRMQGNDPPDTFQVHAGPELMDGYVKADKMQPVTDLYTKMNIQSAFPKQLLDMISKDGQIYGVPADIHRGNVLFYNKKIFTDNNLQPPTTWDEFYSVCQTLAGKNIPCVAIGGKDTWSVTMLFEDIMLANAGPDKYMSLYSGKTQWTDPSVIAALTGLQKVWQSKWMNSDFAARTWDEASGQVLKGQAAMQVMGDWAKGYFQANDPNWATDIGWEPSPGTSGIFKVISDVFGVPKGIKNPENTNNFLALLASKTGQVTFNLRKGSLPARTDVDTSQFDVYMKSANADFTSAKALVGSAPHGSATNDAFASAINTAVNTFISNPTDPNAAATNIQNQATDLLTP